MSATSLVTGMSLADRDQGHLGQPQPPMVNNRQSRGVTCALGGRFFSQLMTSTSLPDLLEEESPRMHLAYTLS